MVVFIKPGYHSATVPGINGGTGYRQGSLPCPNKVVEQIRLPSQNRQPTLAVHNCAWLTRSRLLPDNEKDAWFQELEAAAVVAKERAVNKRQREGNIKFKSKGGSRSSEVLLDPKKHRNVSRRQVPSILLSPSLSR